MVKVYQKTRFLSGKFSRSFIYPSLSNSGEKFQKGIYFKIIGSHHTLSCFKQNYQNNSS